MLAGGKVAKKSGKPFKSRLMVNTVKGVLVVNLPSASINGERVMVQREAYAFVEDDSFVVADACVCVDERCTDCIHTLIEHEEQGWTCDCLKCPWKNKS